MREMKNVIRVIREVAYVGLAAAMVLMVWRLVIPWIAIQDDHSYMKTVRERIADRPTLLANRRVSVCGERIGEHARSVFLSTSPMCRYCTDSAPFHRAVAKQAGQQSIPFYVVLPKADQASQYLFSIGLQGAKVKDREDISLRAEGTPAITLVDSKCTVKKVWLGTQTTAQENEVLRALENPGAIRSAVRSLPSGTPVLTLTDIKRQPGSDPVTVLNTVEREHFDSSRAVEGSLNIPLQELRVCAPHELDPQRLVLVACTGIADAFCDDVISQVTRLGFRARSLGATPTTESRSGWRRR